ncbi:MAG: hypothetical protein WCC53_03495 [Thermoanaerobaculia bacterium]|jgi:hypothetical protein
MPQLTTLLILAALWLEPYVHQARSGERTADSRPPLECVTFKTPTRLLAGHSFAQAIGRGMEVRLRSRQGAAWAAWGIEVGPVGTTTDYLWIASPPFQTAPHRQIGNGYDFTARDSVALSPRRLRFVTSAAEYDHAIALADRAGRDASAGITADDFTALGKGSLELWITRFDLNERADDLNWISVRGRACQPR